MTNICEFSPCRKWRYTLWRKWDEGFFEEPKGYMMVIGLNPSTADETKDDPTIRRCIAFAKQWGYNGLCMTNIFAWRDTKPEDMRKAEDPIGPANNHWLVECAQNADLIVAAWGKHGTYLNRSKQVVELMPKGKLVCLKKNEDGSPQHPLYIPSNIVPVSYP